jgi:hypothetical protein
MDRGSVCSDEAWTSLRGDPSNNQRRTGRVLIARGRDALSNTIGAES